MNNKVYYGEYTLQFWIDQILRGYIILPEYQRYFVWSEENVRDFIENLKDDQFVPSVTIGKYSHANDKDENLIIDGQQRLTSLLLAYLDIFPEKKKKNSEEGLADENDDILPSDSDVVQEWRFTELTSLGKEKQEILARLPSSGYKQRVGYGVDEDFFNNHYLGFSYLVPFAADDAGQTNYYSKLFRNINRQGVVLSDLETRAALYYLKPSLKEFFTPSFNTYTIQSTVGVKKKMDFVRYMSLLSQYAIHEKKNEVAVGCNSRRMDPYYEEYVYAVINDDATRFKKFSEIFNDDFCLALSRLKKSLESFKMPQVFMSIIDMDVYFFGMIYITMFLGKSIVSDEMKQQKLKEKLFNKISQYKKDEKHKKSPAGIGNLRKRLEESIKLYKGYSE